MLKIQPEYFFNINHSKKGRKNAKTTPKILHGLLLNNYYIDTTTVLINNEKLEPLELIESSNEQEEIEDDLIERYIINDELDEEEKTEKCIFKDCRNEAVYGKSGYCKYHYKQLNMQK